MRDYIVYDQKEKERDRFISSMKKEEASIIKLASSYHDNDDCRVFRTQNGAFNLCFFVEFVSVSDNGQRDRWVVRIPIPSRVYWVEEKLEVEVATMKYVAANTSIPIPQIQAYSLSKDNPIHMPFLILEYVDGYTLRELGFPSDNIWRYTTKILNQTKRRIFEQLADVYIQLRRQEFPKIGALGLPTKDQATAQVCHRPLFVEIIIQTDEGCEPSARFQKGVTFDTSTEFTNALLWLAENGLIKGRNSGVDMREGRKVLYAMSDFAQFIRNQWLDRQSENGPFALMHGDMSINNLLWDKDFQLRAVLDWEWSCVVPSQYLVPPIWLTCSNAVTLSYGPYFYDIEVGHFRAVLRDREMVLGARSPLLSEEWADMDKFCHTLVVSALFHPEHLYDVYWNFLSPQLARDQLTWSGDRGEYDRSIAARLDAFMDDARTVFLEKKRQEQTEYIRAEENHFRD